MGKEQPPEFYDGVKYDKPHIYKRYKVVYKAAADMLPDQSLCPKIIDLGCGVGHFAKIIYDRGYIEYLGIDFSSQMIERAQEKVPIWRFVIANLLSEQTKDHYSPYCVFVLLEVLEHINDDFEVLKRIPKGSQVIFSMPSFDARSHVRRFKNADLVINRYKAYLRFNKTKVIDWKKGSYVFLFDCVKR